MTDMQGSSSFGADIPAESSFPAEDASTMSSSAMTGQATGGVVDTVQDAAGAVTDTVKQATGAVTDTVQNVTEAVSDQVDKVTNTAADKVEQLSDKVAQTAFSGDAPQVQRQVAATTVSVLDKSAEYLRNGDVDVILEDLRNTVRRHPLRSLVLGLGLGYLARGTFFPATGGQGQRGSQSRSVTPSYAPPRPIPIYTAQDTASYDTTRSNTGTTTSMTGDFTTSATDVAGDVGLTNSMQYGSDLSSIGGGYTSDQSSSSSLGAAGTSVGTDTDLTGGTLGTGGSDFATSSINDVSGSAAAPFGMADDFAGGTGDTTLGGSTTGIASDTAAIPYGTDAGLTGGSFGTLDSDFGTSTTDVAYAGTNADLTGATGSIADDTVDATDAMSSDQFSVSDDASTGASDLNTTPSNDVVKRWDQNTRKRKR